MRTVVAFDHVDQRDWYRQMVLNLGLECGADDCVPYSKLHHRLVEAEAELVLVAIGHEPHQGVEAIQGASAKVSTPILAIGATDDARQVLEVLRAGAREFIDIDNARDELLKALAKLRKTGAVSFRKGHTISVVGAIPGTGVTTVASGLAFALLARAPKQVVLAELGAGIPELALDLDLKPKNNVAEVLRDWDRMDLKTIRQALTEHASGMQVLADAPGTLESAPLQPAAGKHIVALLRSIADYVVVDLGHQILNLGVQATLEFSDRVVVVFRLDVPSLRLTQVLLKKLIDRGTPLEKICLVGNRYGQRRQIAWRKAEETLGTKVAHWVPDDPGRVNYAINQGYSVLQGSRWAKIARTFDQIAHSVNGVSKSKPSG